MADSGTETQKASTRKALVENLNGCNCLSCNAPFGTKRHQKKAAKAVIKIQRNSSGTEEFEYHAGYICDNPRCESKLTGIVRTYRLLWCEGLWRLEGDAKEIQKLIFNRLRAA